MEKRRDITIMTITGLLFAAPYARAETPYSTNLYGALGLNTIPNARMDKVGTIRTQLSYLDPYLHGFLGMQIAEPLYIGIRQSAEGSSFNQDFDRLFPGIDAKLRLHKESAHAPEIAIGVQSALGHIRQSGEYIALSKRYKDFDFTGGIGWGRFASGAQIDNPLKALGSHFDKDRSLDGENPNRPQNWFTGQDIGFFAGLEYFTPLKGLSLKADFGGDRYEAERQAFNFDTPAPWSLGFNYKPWNFMDLGIAAQGTDKVMARLSFQGNIKDWPHQSKHKKLTKPLAPYRTKSTDSYAMQTDARDNNLSLSHIALDSHSAQSILSYNRHHSAPHQFGKAATHIANNAGENIEAIIIEPRNHNLRGPNIHLMRKSLESAFAHNNGSPHEVWHTTEFKHGFKGLQKFRPHSDPDRSFGLKNIAFTLDNQISLAEEDTSLLHRTSFITDIVTPDRFKYFTAGLGLRLNLSDNLGKIRRNRARQAFPIKSDIADFADRTFALDTAYTALTHTIMPDTHASLISGYVEEHFAGIGSEVLYRPYDKRYAIGGELWAVQKRDPFTFANLGTRDGTLLTAQANAWYDIPKADVTLGFKAGRYLAKDFGASLSVSKSFKNGAELEGYVSISDKADFDLFGGTTHADHGLRLKIPLGGFKYTPNANINLTAAPFGRDIGQSVKNPLPLYEATNKFSLSYISRHWDELNE